MQVKLQGIPGIKKVFMREKQETRLNAEGNFDVETQWVLDTDGVNLAGVRAVVLCGCCLCLKIVKGCCSHDRLSLSLL